MNELDFARNEIAKLHDDIHELTEERDELRATIERMEQQVPIAYYWMNLEKSKPEIGPSPSDRWLSWPLYEFPGAQEQPVQGVPGGWLERGLTELENIRNCFDDSTLMNDKTLIERLFIAMTTTPEDKP